MKDWVESNLIVQESHGSTTQNTYEISRSNSGVFTKHVRSDSKYWHSFDRFFRSAFLPHGYPESVSKDYFEYQVWDSIQAFASSITGSICTHAVLTGAGVGDQNASALAATLTWLYKDGTSMIGRIIFAWCQGTSLDCECKKWRLFADVMNDVAMLLDLLSAYFRAHFLFIICLSGLLKSIVGVAGGSTRAALTQHQARKNNMADVSAKDGSQETLVNLLALICSLFLVPVVTKDYMLTWLVFILMTIIHLMANYFAVRAVSMDNFNIPRFRIFAEKFLSGPQQKASMCVDAVNKEENVLFSLWSDNASIKLGCSFQHLISHRKRDIREILKLYNDTNYILYISYWDSSKISINIAFNRKADVVIQMLALYHACVLIHWQIKPPPDVKRTMLNYEELSKSLALRTFDDFIKCAQLNEFITDSVWFESDIWKLEW